MINHRQPKINGDGSYSRDFTYIENVIQANEKALFTTEEQIAKGQHEYYNIDLEKHKYFGQGTNATEQQGENLPLTPSPPHPFVFSEVFNVAYGGNTNLVQLFEALRDDLARFDNPI